MKIDELRGILYCKDVSKEEFDSLDDALTELGELRKEVVEEKLANDMHFKQNRFLEKKVERMEGALRELHQIIGEIDNLSFIRRNGREIIRQALKGEEDGQGKDKS